MAEETATDASQEISQRLVTVIMNVTATIAMTIPITILAVSGSPNMSVPTRIAVIGSNTPRTDAFVAPMFREATANVAVETTVGNRASPNRLNQSVPVVMHEVSSVPEYRILPRKTKVPTTRVQQVSNEFDMEAMALLRLMMTMKRA